MKEKNEAGYLNCMQEIEGEILKVKAEIREIAFDYFNIIAKEYECSYEKYKNDEEFKNRAKEYSVMIEKEYID